MAGVIKSTLEALHITSPAPARTLAPPSDAEAAALKADYEKHGQGHVFAFWKDLNDEEKAQLYNQLNGFKPARIAELVKDALNPPPAEETPKVEPLPESATASILDSDPEDIQKWYESGLESIGAGEVAVILLAGGQGTRLGSSDPKGCYDVGLPSRKSLFQLQAERILKVQELAAAKVNKKKVVVPWYIMTSGPTRGPTEAFFEKNNYFGLEKDDVTFFEQGVLPCISNEGKILLQTKSKVAVAPDGNGGIYQAIIVSSVLESLKSRGIKHVHTYCVDNSLVRVADPAFIGFAASKDVDLATKVVRKRAADESVGLIILKNGKPDVVEYSEIDQETCEALDEKDKSILKFRAANIVNHYYSVRYLESIPIWVNSLPHHIARKKIPYLDTETGEEVSPSKPNGIKLEQFVFDVFPQIPLDKFACLEVRREDEFSPLKNGKGSKEDNPETSRADVMAQGTRWLKAAGAFVISEDPEETGVEVSPLISYGGEGLELFTEKEIIAPAKIEREDA
ncbi:nucleotide-diphospho-sugar transferase [Peziza echinospora]|nr:nucleotide-diphospho-sugar transferase [Peziza echinospora]